LRRMCAAPAVSDGPRLSASTRGAQTPLLPDAERGPLPVAPSRITLTPKSTGREPFPEVPGTVESAYWQQAHHGESTAWSSNLGGSHNLSQTVLPLGARVHSPCMTAPSPGATPRHTTQPLVMPVVSTLTAQRSLTPMKHTVPPPALALSGCGGDSHNQRTLSPGPQGPRLQEDVAECSWGGVARPSPGLRPLSPCRVIRMPASFGTPPPGSCRTPVHPVRRRTSVPGASNGPCCAQDGAVAVARPTSSQSNLFVPPSPHGLARSVEVPFMSDALQQTLQPEVFGRSSQASRHLSPRGDRVSGNVVVRSGSAEGLRHRQQNQFQHPVFQQVQHQQQQCQQPQQWESQQQPQANQQEQQHYRSSASGSTSRMRVASAEKSSSRGAAPLSSILYTGVVEPQTRQAPRSMSAPPRGSPPPGTLSPVNVGHPSRASHRMPVAGAMVHAAAESSRSRSHDPTPRMCFVNGQRMKVTTAHFGGQQCSPGSVRLAAAGSASTVAKPSSLGSARLALQGDVVHGRTDSASVHSSSWARS